MVGGVEGIGELNADFDEALQGRGVAGVETVEGLAVEQFHGEEGLAFALIDFVDGADAGVIEGGGDAGFAVEALERSGLGGGGAADALEGDVTAEAEVLSFVDDAHTPRADGAEDFVVTQGRASLELIHRNHYALKAGDRE